MVPIPHATSWDELNTQFEADCRRRRERRLRGYAETIGERFVRDCAAMLPLPPAPYEACEKVSVRYRFSPMAPKAVGSNSASALRADLHS